MVKERLESVIFSRVVSDYQAATVTTSLKTSTADLSLAAFPKIVICNKYQLRYLSFTLNFSEKIISRQSLLEAVGMCVKNSSLSDMSFAINKILLTGFDNEVLCTMYICHRKFEWG